MTTVDIRKYHYLVYSVSKAFSKPVSIIETSNHRALFKMNEFFNENAELFYKYADFISKGYTYLGI